MKKLFLSIVLLAFGMNECNAQNPLRLEDGYLIWQKVYEEDLNIESQTLTLNYSGRRNKAAYLMWLAKAEMRVDKKDGRTRITITDIQFKNHGEFDGRLTPIESIIVKHKNGQLRPWFFGRGDAKVVHDLLVNKINSLLDANKDW